MSIETIVRVREVSRVYGKEAVLDGVSLEIPKAQIFGLLGPSGAGKTTLVRMIAGIDIASSGTIDLLNVRMPKLNMLKHIGYMSQSDALYTELTAKENLEFFASIYGLTNAKRRQRIEEVMSLVNLTDELHKQVQHYSGGMKRRLSLAIALLHSPQLLILDEPTVGIDPVLRQSIWQELSRLSDQGTTIIVTTHVMDEAYKCHQLGMIREGKFIATGSPQYLMEQTNSATLEEAFLQYGGVNA